MYNSNKHVHETSLDTHVNTQNFECLGMQEPCHLSLVSKVSCVVCMRVCAACVCVCFENNGLVCIHLVKTFYTSAFMCEHVGVSIPYMCVHQLNMPTYSHYTKVYQYKLMRPSFLETKH